MMFFLISLVVFGLKKWLIFKSRVYRNACQSREMLRHQEVRDTCSTAYHAANIGIIFLTTK